MWDLTTALDLAAKGELCKYLHIILSQLEFV